MPAGRKGLKYATTPADTFVFATALERPLGWKGAVPANMFASYVVISRLPANRHWFSAAVFRRRERDNLHQIRNPGRPDARVGYTPTRAMRYRVYAAPDQPDSRSKTAISAWR